MTCLNDKTFKFVFINDFIKMQTLIELFGYQNYQQNKQLSKIIFTSIGLECLKSYRGNNIFQ